MLFLACFWKRQVKTSSPTCLFLDLKMQGHSFYRYHWVIQPVCRLLCIKSSSMRLANLPFMQISLLCYLYDSCFELYICYWVFRCLFQKQPSILLKLILFCKFQHTERYIHPLFQNEQRIQNNFITASQCPSLKEIIGRSLFYWLKCAAFSFFSLMSLCRLWSLSWWFRESEWLWET